MHIIGIIGIGFSLALIAALAAMILWVQWHSKQVQQAENWPATEATLESGAIEIVQRTQYGVIRLPVFCFSYKVAGDYYSGRFALGFPTDEPEVLPRSLIEGMIGRKLPVKYNPARPDQWFFPDPLIDGLEVQQKLSSPWPSLSPED